MRNDQRTVGRGGANRQREGIGLSISRKVGFCCSHDAIIPELESSLGDGTQPVYIRVDPDFILPSSRLSLALQADAGSALQGRQHSGYAPGRDVRSTFASAGE